MLANESAADPKPDHAGDEDLAILEETGCYENEPAEQQGVPLPAQQIRNSFWYTHDAEQNGY